MYSFYFSNIKFLVFIVFCYYILAVDIVTLGFGVFVGVVAALVATGLSVVIVIIDTSVSIVSSSISSQILVTGDTLEDLFIPRLILSLLLGRYAL